MLVPRLESKPRCDPLALERAMHLCVVGTAEKDTDG